MSDTNNTIIKLSSFSHTDTSNSDYVGSVRGYLKAIDLPKITGILNIDSNPRKPKESKVTKDIAASIEESPGIFHLMSKGLLLSGSECTVLDRGRIRIDIRNTDYSKSGILDGGHNMFAILKHFLITLNYDVSKLKKWDDIITVWRDNQSEINKAISNTEDKIIQHSLDFLIPIEVIYPKDPKNKTSLHEWGITHSNITHARNNNAELVSSTKDNQQGYYEYLKEILPTNIKNSIQWKTNGEGTIRVADVLALALIPLSVVPQEVTGVNLPANLVKIYNSKAYCVDTFKEILDKNGSKIGGNEFQLQNTIIKSALELVPDILRIYDYIYAEYPKSYNKDGSFGKMEVVKIYDVEKSKEGSSKYLKKQPKTKFLNNNCKYSYADGLIIPLVVAIKELIYFDKHSQSLKWKVIDPIDFLKDNLDSISKIYNMVIRMASYNPQKIGKDSGSYELAASALSSRI
ncbi:hypothetical protein [Psychrobacter frigidicola]|uniref:hypothetical protein n=1 Tax=Psychrobacter frigidicola TaxID=45611 RepID=UPI00191AA862|nr:hypothetical protein [Psychrobacter frigidicola]